MTFRYEDKPIGAVIKNEYDIHFCRDEVIILSGSGVLKPNTLLGKITASGKYKPITPGASDGSQNAAGILVSYVDATAADAKAIALVRGPAMVYFPELIVPAVFTAGNKSSAILSLLALNIKTYSEG